MKKFLLLVTALFVTMLSYSQVVINQSFSPSSNLKVGDTITVTYSVSGAGKARYLWLRYQYNANAIDRKSTRLNSSHSQQSRMPSSA